MKKKKKKKKKKWFVVLFGYSVPVLCFQIFTAKLILWQKKKKKKKKKKKHKKMGWELIINSANNLFTWGISAFAFFRGFLF